MSNAVDFLVERANLENCTVIDSIDRDLADGQARLRITNFAFTANNITYSVAGDMLGYWTFFPADDGWGRIPVWGIGEVEESKVEGIVTGDRYYGYFPMSTHLIVEPAHVSESGFVDGTSHRASLPKTYNQYSRMTPELGFDPRYDDMAMLFRPLYMTSFLIDDYLEENDFFGAKTLVISSASSKTSIGLAFCVSQRASRPELVGLTSPGNREFTEGLGLYDRVIVYNDIGTLSNEEPASYVDMAGNASVTTQVHNHFGNQLKSSTKVGFTHWQNGGDTDALPGAKPSMFFAPDRIVKRAKDWGGGGLQQKFGGAWVTFTDSVGDWMSVVHGDGQEAVKQIYLDTLHGKTSPSQGHIVCL